MEQERDFFVIGGDSGLVRAIENLPEGFLPDSEVFYAEYISEKALVVIRSPVRFPMTLPPKARRIPALRDAFSYKDWNYQIVFEEENGSTRN